MTKMCIHGWTHQHCDGLAQIISGFYEQTVKALALNWMGNMEEEAGETKGNRLECSFSAHTHTHRVHISTDAAPHECSSCNPMQKKK